MELYLFSILLAELTAVITGIYFFKQIKNRFLLLFTYVVIGFLMESIEQLLIV